MLFTKNNPNPKSLSAGSIPRTGGGRASQDPVRKAGQSTPRTTVRPASASILAPALKATEPAKPPKASNRLKPFAVSKTLGASKVLNAAQPPTALKPIPACKPLSPVGRSSDPKVLKVTKAPNRLKTPAASKVLDIARAADAPKAAPSLKAPDALKTSSPRAAAVDAIRRQINEQKQNAAAITARKAKAKSEPIPSAKPGITRDATSVSRPKAKATTATANAAQNVPPPGTPTRRPLPALRKSGVRKPVFVISRSYSTPSPPNSPPHTDGGCSRHQRNSLSASARLSERTGLTRRNAIRKLDPVIKPRASTHAPAVLRTSSAPLLGWAKAPTAVMRSTSGPILAREVVKIVVPQPEDTEVQSKILQVMNVETPSGDEGAVDASLTAKVSKAGADTSSSRNLVGLEKDTSVHLPLELSPPFQNSIQDFDVQSAGSLTPCTGSSISSLSSMSFSSILDLFPAVPEHIPGPVTQDMHRELASMSPAFAADKTAADSAHACDSLSSPSSTSSILSILDQFPIVPTYIPSTPTPEARLQFPWLRPTLATDKPVANIMLADEEIVRTVIVSLDGEAPVFDTPPAWKVAFDSESLSGSATAVGSSVSSQEGKTPVVSKAATGVKKWWGHVVGRK